MTGRRHGWPMRRAPRAAPGYRAHPLRRVRRPALERAVQGLTDIAQRCLGGTAVVVSHDAVNRQVLVAFDAGPGDPDAIQQDNGCVNTLEWRDGRWLFSAVGELPAEPPDTYPGGR